jgi:DNA phosphorothioation-associated putative methyltransferase
VLNVIENADERAEVLERAWSLTGTVLLVSARTTVDQRDFHSDLLADGYRTKLNTFQKYYAQDELRGWIEAGLGEPAIAAAPGVFFVFRKSEDRQSYLHLRYMRRRAAPRIRQSDVLFETHRELLQELLEFLTARGRVPQAWEISNAAEIEDAFGSLRRAYSVIRRVTGTEQWERVRVEREEELSIYFALDLFGSRPRFGELPRDLQRDVKDYFTSYRSACAHGDALLFGVGDLERLGSAMSMSSVGKRTQSALYVHVEALHEIPPLLRVYEGCARAYIGDVEGANIVKLSREKPCVSYLSYPDFDSDPHPQLSASLSVDLHTFRVRMRSYIDSKNAPILHRKEEFVSSSDTRYAKFARLTRQELRFGLYEDVTSIGQRDGWERLLLRKGLELRGHRVVRR